MRLRTLPIAAATLLFVGAVILLAGAPAGGQQPCLFSDCRPQEREVTTTTAGIAATSSTTPGATTSTTSDGEVPTSTSTTAGGGPGGGPGAGPTTTTSVPELPRRAPTGGLPITGGDAIVLVLVGFGAVALGAGILRRS